MSKDFEDLFGDTSGTATFVDLVHRHEQSEYDQDVDKALDTVCMTPHYTVMPLRWTIRDRALLRDFYAAIVPMFRNFIPNLANRSVFYGKAGLVIWDRALQLRLDDGRTIVGDILAIVTRDPNSGLVSGEHAFIGDDLAEAFKRQVGPEIDRRLREHAPAER